MKWSCTLALVLQLSEAVTVFKAEHVSENL